MTTTASQTPPSVEPLLRRDQAFALVGLAIVTVLAWTYLAREAAAMKSMAIEARVHAAMGMADMRTWGLADGLALFVMWAVMMVAMMLPSASPIVLLILSVYRRRGDRLARASSIAFVGGYLLVWTAFSAVAAATQTGLHRAAFLTPDMATGSAVLGGLILIAVGIYQWLPIKDVCLSHCQSPLAFLTTHWREGVGGALRMGLGHGLFCVGCCWALMALLFVVGVMNLFWVAAIAAFVLLEKLTPRLSHIGHAAGAVLIAWGAYVLVQPIMR